ncbi:hypothetical protein [Hymenobacter sp. BRD67]|uniref:hypothetical protein n=1 Tax=Hymenobacter sp. BRD67 TaxID=2675877 RepID=UPI0015657E38|nr:hypothetical protein [Hymenobacter sp. BRD67]QKG52712.1 hypothetical protein GKZ67_08995 [Hymenobacter sp. BRD67]
MLAPIELESRIISFRTDLQVMVVRWHTHASLGVVQADYARMLRSAEEAGMNHWLLDVRRREKVAVELSAWVTDSFYPEAVARLAPRRLRMAVLSSPALFEVYRSDAEHKKYVEYAVDRERPYDIGLFHDEGEAMQWLCAPDSTLDRL